ncbi:S1 RNA-binding domain-containing protein [Candidatus Woesearchaeota archaeon]|nr:S1 RNA-binding domain-containing protein [Candidatus Woesearchaeota archaeon]
MLLKKQGLPEDDELVLCTVTKIHFHSVFVNLDEYNMSAMIHISEIAPGRIRNIRDFVVEGKVIVCKVLRVDRERGHVDLSLRRVNDSQKRLKLEGIKKQQKVEKIVEQVAKQLKLDNEKLLNEISEIVLKKYDSVHDGFESIVKGETNLEELGIDKKYIKELDESIRTRIKPEEVIIKGKFVLKSYEADGNEVVKSALKKAIALGNKKTSLVYIGAGSYKLVIKAEEYKEAESVLKNMTDAVTKHMKAPNNFSEFVRDE